MCKKIIRRGHNMPFSLTYSSICCSYHEIEEIKLASFASPARSGRGILVAPGFCPASCHVFLWAQKLKNTGQFFLKFKHHIPSNMGMCKWFFRDATKIQNGRQRSTLKNFVGAKTYYSNITITFPMIWRCGGDFFKVLLKFKMAAIDQL